MPRYYSQKYRNHLKANPTSVDLRSVCQVYYQLGMRLSPLNVKIIIDLVRNADSANFYVIKKTNSWMDGSFCQK